MKLDDWQLEIISDKSKYILLCKGRQIGGTTLLAEKAADRLANQKGCKILVGSITEDQAKLVVLMVREVLERKYKSWLKVPKKDKPTQDRIILNNKSEFRSRPVGNTGDSFRGFTANVIWLNEASKWPELAIQAIKPTLLTTGGDIWMDSTPAGKQGYFWECFQNKAGLFKVYYKTSEEVTYNRPISEDWTVEKREASIKFLEHERATMSNLEYGQEYLGLFMDDLNRLLSDAIIERSAILKKNKGPINKNANYFLGCDIARLGEDENSFQVLEKKSNEAFYHIEDLTSRKQDLVQTSEYIASLDKLYSFNQVGIDTNGVGGGVFDILRRDIRIRRKLKDIWFQKKSTDYDPEHDAGKKLLKEDMYLNFVAMLEKGELLLLDDADLKLCLRSIQYEYIQKPKQPSRLRVFVSPHNLSHRVDGLVIAAWLAKGKNLSIWFKVL